MSNRKSLLAASLLSFVSSLSLAAACSSDTSGEGAGPGGPSAGATSTGGVVGTGGTTGSGAVVGTGGTPAATGGTSVAPATGGVTSTSGGVAGSPGGGLTTGGATSTTGGATTSGGTPSTGGAAGGGGAGAPAATGGTSAGGAGPSGADCKLPTLPDSGSLMYNNKKLPDPFTFFDGTKVTTKAQWECRRKEILAMADKYLYGPVPPAPEETTGTVSGSSISMTVKAGGKTEMFTASVSGSGDVIAYELSGGIYPSGRRKLTFGSGFEGKIRTLFGLSEVNTNVAIGWMIDRVMDVLEKNPDSGLDPKKIMVSGCSGCGKGAFLVGVFSRVPLTVIVESGGGGAANLRMTEWFRHGEGKNIYKCSDAAPQGIDNLEDTGICGPWVTNAARWLRQSPAKVYNLPFDQHLLLATIAPRYLVHFTNDHGTNSWCHLGGTGEAFSAWAAKPVFKALGVPERMAFLQYSAGHCGNPAAATSLAGEMFKRVFQGDMAAKTDVLTIMDDGVQQPVSEWKGMWIDWDMEAVLQ